MIFLWKFYSCKETSQFLFFVMCKKSDVSVLKDSQKHNSWSKKKLAKK